MLTRSSQLNLALHIWADGMAEFDNSFISIFLFFLLLVPTFSFSVIFWITVSIYICIHHTSCLKWFWREKKFCKMITSSYISSLHHSEKSLYTLCSHSLLYPQSRIDSPKILFLLSLLSRFFSGQLHKDEVGHLYTVWKEISIRDQDEFTACKGTKNGRMKQKISIYYPPYVYQNLGYSGY